MLWSEPASAPSSNTIALGGTGERSRNLHRYAGRVSSRPSAARSRPPASSLIGSRRSMGRVRAHQCQTPPVPSRGRTPSAETTS